MVVNASERMGLFADKPASVVLLPPRSPSYGSSCIEAVSPFLAKVDFNPRPTRSSHDDACCGATYRVKYKAHHKEIETANPRVKRLRSMFNDKGMHHPSPSQRQALIE